VEYPPWEVFIPNLDVVWYGVEDGARRGTSGFGTAAGGGSMRTIDDVEYPDVAARTELYSPHDLRWVERLAALIMAATAWTQEVPDCNVNTMAGLSKVLMVNGKGDVSGIARRHAVSPGNWEQIIRSDGASKWMLGDAKQPADEPVYSLWEGINFRALAKMMGGGYNIKTLVRADGRMVVEDLPDILGAGWNIRVDDNPNRWPQWMAHMGTFAGCHKLRGRITLTMGTENWRYAEFFDPQQIAVVLPMHLLNEASTPDGITCFAELWHGNIIATAGVARRITDHHRGYGAREKALIATAEKLYSRMRRLAAEVNMYVGGTISSPELYTSMSKLGQKYCALISAMSDLAYDADAMPRGTAPAIVNEEAVADILVVMTLFWNNHCADLTPLEVETCAPFIKEVDAGTDESRAAAIELATQMNTLGVSNPRFNPFLVIHMNHRAARGKHGTISKPRRTRLALRREQSVRESRAGGTARGLGGRPS